MPEDLIALVQRLASTHPEERQDAIRDAYTYVCHQAQTVYPQTVETIEPLVALAVDPRCPGRADALKLLADIAASTNSAPGDYDAVRSAVQTRLDDLARSVRTNPTPATAVALAQLAWSYPHDRSIDDNSLQMLLQHFDEAYVILAVALALQARGVSHPASFAFHAAFAEAESSAEQGPGRVGAALRALRLRSSS
jgi:hypothetical protein